MNPNFKILLVINILILLQGCSSSTVEFEGETYLGSEIDSIKNEYVNSIVIYNIPLDLKVREVNNVEVLMLKENYFKSIFGNVIPTKYNICDYFKYDTLSCEVKVFSLEILNKTKEGKIKKQTGRQAAENGKNDEYPEVDTTIKAFKPADTDTIEQTEPHIKIDTPVIIIEEESSNNEFIIDKNDYVIDAVEIKLDADFELYDLNIKRITPISKNIQVLSDVKESKWIWKVLPKKKGEINFQVIVDANRQYNDGRPGIIHNLDTYEQKVKVNSTLKKDVLFIIEERWWLILIGLISISLIYLWKIGKLKYHLTSHRKNKELSLTNIIDSKNVHSTKQYLIDAKKFIKNGNIEDALNILIDNVPKNKKELNKMLILFSSKYAIIKRETLAGLLDENRKNQNSAHLINGIIEVISELENDSY